MSKQCNRVVDYMEQYGSITGDEAREELGVAHLSSRITDLEQSGWQIDRKTETGPNRYGEKTHWTRYTIKNPPSALVQPTAEKDETTTI